MTRATRGSKALTPLAVPLWADPGRQARRNSDQIPNYGERYRCGEPISTATAEATVNQVISHRMVKKQQMRWSPRGAHLLLQIRTRVLNGDLAADFARWYPRFATPDQHELGDAA